MLRLSAAARLRQARAHKEIMTYQAPEGIPSPEEKHSLLLYKSDGCPFCIRVFDALDKLGLELEMRDTWLDPGARAQLRQATGRTQVPCLFIDGVPFFESRDIILWLMAYARGGGV